VSEYLDLKQFFSLNKTRLPCLGIRGLIMEQRNLPVINSWASLLFLLWINLVVL